MTTLGELLSSARQRKGISQRRAAQDLLIKEENLVAIEKGHWRNLPEPAYVKGFIKSYASYLGIDTGLALALYRREFDETTYPKKSFPTSSPKRLQITPPIVAKTAFSLAVLIFIIYFLLQYLSILKAPQLEIITPAQDISTNVPLIVITGRTEKNSTVSVNGEFAPVDKDGDFAYQYNLKDGQNVIEIIAAKQLSPKTKITRIVRLTR